MTVFSEQQKRIKRKKASIKNYAWLLGVKFHQVSKVKGENFSKT